MSAEDTLKVRLRERWQRCATVAGMVADGEQERWQMESRNVGRWSCRNGAAARTLADGDEAGTVGTIETLQCSDWSDDRY